ncbi:hypothetical protein [Acetobacterium tundrae]|uniref:Uncharacterized protein n=1 Tax=Acetobacterium tundrae TaxID=132932 RepID=A0ABR6WQH6_9FIRM|nr:hypothetical protein [Acetobacterium tundrae]MBC3798619.1 hypothetical protein [Acetobacterium tundrae]
MKVRGDFVTNSSSTSFIVSIKDEFNENNFIKGIGIEGESAINKIFKDLFDAINDNKAEIHDYIKNFRKSSIGISGFLEEEGFDQETISLVEKLIRDDRKVYYGKISSDGSSASEAYFCMESFLVCDDDIYFNGKIGGW